MTFRTHTCSSITAEICEKRVTISGWTAKRRDHGGVLFIDLRDRSGICQCVIPAELSRIEGLRTESVLRIEGVVKRRPDGMVNSKIPSGEIEIHATRVDLISEAQALPFNLDDDADLVNENTRLKYRYLDLRRPRLQKNFLIRHRILQSTRRFFDEQGFIEVETPILYKSTPEGARDYLVPSRVHPGEFYALPQSPQTLKQLLMVAGFERYFQIARCFRDEDLRADRQPEFSQVDLEVSFLSRDEFLGMIEGYIKRLWKECLGVDLSIPFPRISYDDAMNRFGSDKPDLRYGLELSDLSAVFANSAFKVFSSSLKLGGRVIALPVRQAELAKRGISRPDWSRKYFDELNAVVQPFGLKGVLWAKVEQPGQWNSPAAKFLTPAEIQSVEKELGLEIGDYCFFAADQSPRVLEAMGTLRQHLARELKFVTSGVSSSWPFVWIMQFPLFVEDAETKRLYAAHHPFTSPLEEDKDKIFSNDHNVLKNIKAEAYDLALNGFELGGGSFRIFSPEVQSAMFKALGLSADEAKEKFGFFIEALQYGTPPHGGMALGVDRIAMLMTGEDSLREVIAFPKTARAQDLMSESPSRVDADQLAELRLQIIKTSLA